MLTAWHMSVRMDPELEPSTMAALADALLSLHDEETDCAVHFVGLRLAYNATTDAEALRASFTPRAVGFAPVAPQALHEMISEIEYAEAFEVRFFNLDAGRITIRLEGVDLALSAENPETLLKLTSALVATESTIETEWEDDLAEDAGHARTTLSHDTSALRHSASR